MSNLQTARESSLSDLQPLHQPDGSPLVS
jgi:hypothetical protein